MEERSCWAEEGAGVNYSITGWLSQELFKQAPVSGGLGLITPAKVTPTTLPHCLLLWVCQAYQRIFIWKEGGKRRAEAHRERKRGRDEDRAEGNDRPGEEERHSRG